MSGGGSSSKKKTTPKAAEPAPAPTPGPTVQPFMPGMDNMLAQQLAAGGYGNVGDLLSYFQQIYSPMTMPGSNTAPATTTTPGAGSGSGGGTVPAGWSWEGGRGTFSRGGGEPDWTIDLIGNRPGGRA
jgi:hypothetical protein